MMQQRFTFILKEIHFNFVALPAWHNVCVAVTSTHPHSVQNSIYFTINKLQKYTVSKLANLTDTSAMKSKFNFQMLLSLPDLASNDYTAYFPALLTVLLVAAVSTVVCEVTNTAVRHT